MCCDNQAYDGLNRAKCWGFTSLVFGCFCILGGLNVANSGGNTGVIIGSLGEGIGGILMVIAASQVGCCLQLHREGATMQEMNGAQGKVNSAKGFGMVAIGLYLVSLIGWIMAVMAVLQCANKEGCLQGAERSLTFRAGSNGDIPGQCSVSACEERYGRIGEWGGSWSANHDCVSSKRDSRCSGNTTAYLSSASAFSNLDERVNECYPLLCCLPAGGEPPANFVPLAEHNCPFADGTQDPAYGCQYREFCSLILPIFYGAIGYGPRSHLWRLIRVLPFGPQGQARRGGERRRAGHPAPAGSGRAGRRDGAADPEGAGPARVGAVESSGRPRRREGGRAGDLKRGRRAIFVTFVVYLDV